MTCHRRIIINASARLLLNSVNAALSGVMTVAPNNIARHRVTGAAVALPFDNL